MDDNKRLKWKNVNIKDLEKVQHLLGKTGHKLIIKFNDKQEAFDVFVKKVNKGK